ncbi:MAG: UDP-N-acetylmuramoyl-L-alanyl-D-glutamate--2,6-diaminopimelate ligase [Bacillota bacterium]|nr:UDP-N-acetylmuramoyl-L-alanyl-D-glutamate--2,6-diaminopimelate ligase [Bacillota bacterium]
MLFADLLQALGADIVVRRGAPPDMTVSGIAYDSRKVADGFVFVAIPGAQADGHDFIPQALAAGARVIVAEREIAGMPSQAALLIVGDSRHALAAIAAAFYGYPDRQARLIGVTGTNGKTTTTHLIKWLFEARGHKTGLIGTINNKAGDKLLPATHTTPESLELYGLFALMRDEGCRYLVMEVSSHALAQGRVSACDFSGAVFTNLTQDHLDYHGTIAEYRRSKTRLFAMLDAACGQARYGVINVDDASAADFAEVCAAPLWTYGAQEGSTLRLLHYSASSSGMEFELSYEGQVYDFKIPLIGKFNVYNSMAAIAVALAEGMAIDDIRAAMANAPQVAGRFELVDEGQDFFVVVDYAHTPDGLENLLSAARELKPRRLITVFGCGGNRDNGKRPIMGRIAGRLSDIAIVTSDNPRFEEPRAIIDMVESGIKQVCNNYLVEENRARAIGLAINMAEPGDMVVIAGKGHEDYQLIKGESFHFDDREQAREQLRLRAK